MKAVHRSIFRPDALRRYLSGRDTAVLPVTIQRRRRVPVMLQLNAVECGAACLAMILNYYGRKTAIAECRERCGVDRDGVTARILATVARAYGLRVKAFSLEPTDLRSVQLPAIVHWDFNHFVVVERWSPGRVDIVDPAIGRRQLTAQEFAAHFTGVVLTLEPGVQFDRRSIPRPSWRAYLFKAMAHTPGVLAQIVGASLVLQLLGLALPIMTQVLVDHVLPSHGTSVMTILGIGMVIVVLAQMMMSYLRAALLIALQGRLDSQLMLGFFEHLLMLPYRFFEQRTSGDLLMRLGSNSIIRETLANQTLSAVLDGALVLVYLTILLVQEPALGIIVLTIGALQVALLFGTTRRLHGLMERELVANAESQSYLVEALTGIATLKAFGAEDRALDHWSNLFFNHLNITLRRSHLSAVVETALTTLRLVGPLITLWVGTLRVLDGTLSLGTMLALNALATAVLMPLASLVASGQRLQLVGAHLDRIVDVLEAAPEQDLGAVHSAPHLTGQIELKHVSFRYDPQTALVLRDICALIIGSGLAWNSSSTCAPIGRRSA